MLNTPQLSAARKIRNAWRNTLSSKTSRVYAQCFRETGISAAYAKTVGPSALLRSLREPSTVDAIQNILRRVLFVCGCSNHENMDNVNGFSHAYILAFHPERSFDAMDTVELKFSAEARSLITVFEDIINDILSGNRPAETLRNKFLQTIKQYTQMFVAWRLGDIPMFLNRTRRALLAAYRAAEELPDDMETRAQFRSQITSLRDLMEKYVSPSGMQQFDRHRHLGTTALLYFAPRPIRCTNEIIAHEIFLDAAFQLKDLSNDEDEYAHDRYSELGSVEEMQTTSVLSDILATPPNYTRVLKTLNEIRSTLLQLFPDALGRISIDEALDVSTIQYRLERGTFNSTTTLVNAVMRIMRFRQSNRQQSDATAQWNAIVALGLDDKEFMCRAIFLLLKHANTLRIDAANQNIRTVAAMVRAHGPQYTRDKFQQLVAKGIVTTALTTEWLRGSPFNADAQRHHAVALASLISNAAPYNMAKLPETLMYDVKRVEYLRNEFFAILRACLLITSVEHLNDPELNTRILEHVSTAGKRIVMAELQPIGLDRFHALSSPTDPVHIHMRARLHDALVDGILSTELEFPMLAARVHALVEKVSKVGKLNWETHSGLYSDTLAVMAE